LANENRGHFKGCLMEQQSHFRHWVWVWDWRWNVKYAITVSLHDRCSIHWVLKIPQTFVYRRLSLRFSIDSIWPCLSLTFEKFSFARPRWPFNCIPLRADQFQSQCDFRWPYKAIGDLLWIDRLPDKKFHFLVLWIGSDVIGSRSMSRRSQWFHLQCNGLAMHQWDIISWMRAFKIILSLCTMIDSLWGYEISGTFTLRHLRNLETVDRLRWKSASFPLNR
jgi:hypothetical protein